MSTRLEERDSFGKGNAGMRPEACEDAHLEYLDELRESGAVNMFAARPYLMNSFPELTAAEAVGILGYWMTTFGKGSR